MNRVSVPGLVRCALPYVLMTCRKLSKSDDRLLQLFLFGSSAVAKLRNITKFVTTRRAPLQISMGWTRGPSPFSSPWNSLKTRRCPCAPPGSFRPFPPTLPQPGGRRPLSGPEGRWDCSSSREHALKNQEVTGSSPDLTRLLPRWAHAVSGASSQRSTSSGSTVQTVMKTNMMTSRNMGCVSVWVQHPHRTLYSISCLFPSSWGSTWRFFSASETINKSLKSSICSPTSCTLIPDAEMELTCHFHYICDQLFFIAGDLFELRQTDK